MKKKMLLILGILLLSSCSYVQPGIQPQSSSSSSEEVSSDEESSSLISSSVSSSQIISSSEESSSLESTLSSSSSNTSSAISSSSSSTSISYQGEDVNISILEVNDLHGYAYKSSYSGYNLSNIAGYVNDVRNENEVVLIANGDMFQGTAFSNLSHGLSVINALNTMDFDMMGIGNHEFDWTLDEVLVYWDKDLTNGEANFPLVNGNIRSNANDNKLVGEDDGDNNIFKYVITEKAGIKVGLISYIGDQTDSICANKFGSYYIDCYGNDDSKFISNVRSQAIECRNAGAEVIVLNFHEGNSSGVEELNYNQKFSQLVDDNGNYLIDAIINGHTHTSQTGSIARDGGLSVPIVQAGANCRGLGRIDLTISGTTHKVKSVDDNKVVYVSNMNNTSSATQNVLDEEYAKIKSTIEVPLSVSNVNVTKALIGKYFTELMKVYTGADYTFVNTGGIRSTGSISAGDDITIEHAYLINPFDNNIIYVEVTGASLLNYYNENASYNYWNSTFDSSLIDSSATYKIATIDYLYYGSYFQKHFSAYPALKVDVKCARDLLVDDLKLHPSSTSFDKSEIQLSQGTWPK